jgi:hypothetical protein
VNCDKVRYTSRSDAKAAVKRINKAHVMGKRLTDVYLCACGYWHTTSMPKQRSRDYRRFLRKLK